MAQKIEIHAQLREDVGRGASRRLRRLAERVPGIIYGGQADAVALSLNGNELTKVMEAEAIFSQILDVVVDGKKEQAVIRDLQRFPASGTVQHIDFMRISANEPIQQLVAALGTWCQDEEDRQRRPESDEPEDTECRN